MIEITIIQINIIIKNIFTSLSITCLIYEVEKPGISGGLNKGTIFQCYRNKF